MPQKKLKLKLSNKILSVHGRALLKRIFQKHLECIKNLKPIKKITIKNYLKIA